MPSVIVRGPRNQRTHDVLLDDGTEQIGLKFLSGNVGFFEKIPASDPMRSWSDMQEEWTSGMGLRNFRDDPLGYADGQSLWGMTPRKLFPAPQWFFGKGTKTMDFSMPGSVNWQPLTGSYLYVSRMFTATANTATSVKLWVRRVGNPPGSLTLKLYSDASGDPGAAIANSTVTKTKNDITDTVSRLVTFTFPSAQTLTGGTVYHIVVYGDSASNNDHHWEIGMDASSPGGDYSSDGSTWNEASFSLYYMISEAEYDRQLFYFDLEGALYCVTKSADSTVASRLYINGTRGTCTSGTSVGGTTITCTGKFVSGEYNGAGAMVRIIDGAGDGQVFTITSNTADALTITPAVTVALTTSSKFVVYNTPIWHEITGHGLAQVSSRPGVGEKTAWFPQGTSTAIRRGVVNANSYTWNAETSTVLNKCDFINIHHSKNIGLTAWLAVANTSQIYKASVATNTPFSPTINKTKVGSGDYRITSLFNSGGRLWVGKEDGIFYIESDTVTELDSGVKTAPDKTNGLCFTSQGSQTFYGYGNSFAYLLGQETKDILNYRTSFEGVQADRRGYVSAAISVMGWVFIAIDGGANNYSSVRAWNGRGWCELFRGWDTGVRIRDLWYQGNPGARGRLWMDVGGNPVYMDLPQFASNPRNDSTLTYCHEGVMVTGTYSVDKEELYKLIHEVRVTGENLGVDSATNRRWCEVDYQVNDDCETGNWTKLGTIIQNEQSLVLDRGETLKIRFRFRMLTTVNTNPPVLNTIEVNGTISSDEKYQYGLACRVKAKDDFKPQVIEKFLREAHIKRKKLRMECVLFEPGEYKIVTCSLPMPRYESYSPEEISYSGTIQLVLQET